MTSSLVLALVIPWPVAAQVVWPEGELALLPADGGVHRLTLPEEMPLVLVASTEQSDGTRTHAIVWEPGLAYRSWLYVPTRLTFFFNARGGRVALRVVDGTVSAEGKGLRQLGWPDPVERWSFAPSETLADGARLFSLSVMTGSGCPTTDTSHVLVLRAGALTQVLRTESTGEGGGDTLSVYGTLALWGDATFSPTDPLSSVPAAFPPILDVSARERMVVYDVDVSEGALRRATRTIHRYEKGRLHPVRQEEARETALKPAPVPSTLPGATSASTVAPLTEPPAATSGRPAPPIRAPFDAEPPGTVRVLAMAEVTPTSIVTAPVTDGFVACAEGAMHPLGPLLGVEHWWDGDSQSGHPTIVARHHFASPCRRPLFLVQGPGVHAAPFTTQKGTPAGDGGVRYGDVLWQPSRDRSSGSTVACTLTRGGVKQTIEGGFGVCRLVFSGDLNGDGVVDFVVERMVRDPCLDRALLLSTGDRWQIVGDNTTWCPD